MFSEAKGIKGKMVVSNNRENHQACMMTFPKVGGHVWTLRDLEPQ